ncbi:MAG: tRNA (adenosine(37)-N6)-dimethylallyltransferase MiaA [Moraxella equi]|nr:tRNA (adenosine(37)-N6)-dimethylallyltransferase MiaA [Moraxella equi]
MNLHYQSLSDNTVLSLIAPTASGKTDLACRLYETGRFELISVDSALIYEDMNIGTAKPSDDELVRFPHYLVNIIKPTETYNVATFVADVERLISDIHARGKIPLLVGGTMMYYMALLDGLSAVPDTDPAIRQKVMAWLSDKGIGELYAYLQTHDPKICQRLKISDTQRITRAVEVHMQTGTPMSVWQDTPKVAPCHNPHQHWLTLSVEPERAWLHERIAKRLDIMWEQGLVDEVIHLLQKYPDLTPDMPSMRCVGYRQVLEFLVITDHEIMQISPIWHAFAINLQKNNKMTAENGKNFVTKGQNMHDMACQDMKNKALYATRQLAKRQSTWQRQLTSLPQFINANEMNKTKASITSDPQSQQRIFSFASMKDAQNELLA